MTFLLFPYRPTDEAEQRIRRYIRDAVLVGADAILLGTGVSPAKRTRIAKTLTERLEALP